MNIKFNESFFLTVKEVSPEDKAKKPKSVPTNFIFIVDVSGSMSGEIDLIRKQLKNKLPNLIKEGDTITIIWFSGRSDSGVLKEEIEVRSLKNLQEVNSAIDKFLRPIGATAFQPPLELALESIKRIEKNRPGTVFSLIFLTDGYNNDCSWDGVISSLKKLDGKLAASTFVEYGYYADSRRISEMAELVGGEKVEAQRFDDYDVIFENKLQKTYTSSKKIVVDAPTDRKYDFAFTADNDEIILYSISDDQVQVPADTKSLYFFTTKSKGKFIEVETQTIGISSELQRQIYAALYVLSDKLQTESVEEVFKVLGDKHLYTMFTNAYGKEKLMAFKTMVKEAITKESKRFVAGYSKNLVADENAYCVMNFIDDLTEDDNALIYPGHEDFNYKRIGAKKVSAAGLLTEEQKEKIATTTNVEDLKALVAGIDATDLKFEYNDKNKGYAISNLVWSSERANLSVNLTIDGYVNLPENKFGITKVQTHVYRNYTIIKDGILNMQRLPISMSESTFTKFKAQGLVTGTYSPDQIYVVDYSSLPVVNKTMVKNISAKILAEKEYELLQLKALEKVYKYYEGVHFPKVSKGILEQYGAEAETWLRELGITDGGFNPKTTTEKGKDVYMAVELKTKISLHSTIPTVEKTLNRIDEVNDPKNKKSKPLNPVEELMKIAVDDYKTQTTTPLYLSLDEATKTKALETWLKNAKLAVRKKRRALLQEIAQIKFSLILSKKWFIELPSFDVDTFNHKINGKDLTFKFEMTEEEVTV
jgi:Mg-chelatase subunit ChlD